ncbi:hypothetical protein BD310DRAFT_978879 [Dichomitus squalens]|uniref:F-box domain-containing protein n=1 Tax=Dichomitus squalens TaxID=114155 RepID=A0A4Q9PQ42_9APHY|nr:hypothetical protein BD310DRAFT_978879 [Dichomitus squalens]
MLSLPIELQIRVLLNLDDNNTLACRQVCKDFLKMIEDASVQYKVELACAGMVDGGRYGPPPTDRSRLLKVYQDSESQQRC